jgi:hypothetical protein
LGGEQNMTGNKSRARTSRQLNRRDLLRLAAWGGVVGSGSSGLLPALAAQLGDHPSRKRHCVLLWMPGGPSQLDTFDMKPGHAHGGEFSETATTVPGLRFSEHLPQLADWADQLAIVRGLHTSEGDHDRGTYLVRTGQRPGGPLRYPAIGACLAKELGDETAELPQYVNIAPSDFISPGSYGSGFLGPRYAPATVNPDVQPRLAAESDADGGAASDALPPLTRLGLDFLRPDKRLRLGGRMGRAELWDQLQADFLATRSAPNAVVQDTVFRRAMRLMESEAAAAFDLDEEPESVRRRYGAGTFGQGCLLARRLIERGVPFIEVSLGGNQGLGWDTHVNNFPVMRELCQELDAGWSTLMADLQERGLLESTTILWMGEFGRTPVINQEAGRDHYPNAWTCVFAGGGVQGGAIHGKTSEDGLEVIDGQVEIGDVLATLCAALGVHPGLENLTEMGRPLRIAEGNPIQSILAS